MMEKVIEILDIVSGTEKKIDAIMKTLGIMVGHHQTNVVNDGPFHTVIMCKLCTKSESYENNTGVPKWVMLPCEWWD